MANPTWPHWPPLYNDCLAHSDPAHNVHSDDNDRAHNLPLRPPRPQLHCTQRRLRPQRLRTQLSDFAHNLTLHFTQQLTRPRRVRFRPPPGFTPLNTMMTPPTTSPKDCALSWTLSTTGCLRANERQVTTRNFHWWSRVVHLLCTHAQLYRTELACRLSETVGISYGLALIIVGKCQHSGRIEVHGEMLSLANEELDL